MLAVRSTNYASARPLGLGTAELTSVRCQRSNEFLGLAGSVNNHESRTVDRKLRRATGANDASVDFQRAGLARLAARTGVVTPDDASLPRQRAVAMVELLATANGAEVKVWRPDAQVRSTPRGSRPARPRDAHRPT